ncbi:hypothetical protein ACRAVF_19140 [Bradyrhizobium oligotrophicum S58]
MLPRGRARRRVTTLHTTNGARECARRRQIAAGSLRPDNGLCDRIERADCLICAADGSPGFFHGCAINDDESSTITGWTCDGRGHLYRPAS